MNAFDSVTNRRRTVGLTGYDAGKSAGGYTLIAPQTSNGQVFLIDAQGSVVHQWQLPVRPGRHAVILPNGNLGYNGNHPQSEDRYAPWSMWHGGDFYEVTPAGDIVWRYEDPSHHHDALWLDNGDLLYVACEPLSAEFTARIPGGAAATPGQITYGDVIRRVNRQGQLVWEWRAAEHLKPENFPIHAGFGRLHWPLINGLGVQADGTVAMSLRTTSGVIGVNPSNQQVQWHIGADIVSHQHAPVPLANGSVLIFDNGNFRPGSHICYSRVIEVEPHTGAIGWCYQDEVPNWFYTPFMGNAQRLWNGNTHITESSTGRLFEVTPAGEVVWEFVIPWFDRYGDEAARKTGPGLLNSVFQTFRYQASELPWLSTQANGGQLAKAPA